MASRSRDNEKTLTKRQTENLRATAAQHASGIITRLAKHMAGEIELSATQIRAAEILLRKTVPDLSNVEHEGGTEHTHYHITDKALTEDDWEARYNVSGDLAATGRPTESLN